MSDLGCVVLVLGTFGAHVSRLLAVEAKSLLHAFLAFFSGKSPNFDYVYIHGVRITSFGRGGEGVVGLMSGFRVPFGDFFSMLPLGLEGNGLLVPVVNGGGDSVHGHDSAHERRGDPSREVSNKDILISDACKC